MSLKKRYLIIPFFSILVIILLISSYGEVKKRVIEDYDSLQMSLAKQASSAIVGAFVQFNDDLRLMREAPGIIHFDDSGKILMAQYQNLKGEFIKGITRVNAQGKIIYTYPENKNLINRDISYQAHVKKLLTTHERVMSDVFEAVQGYKAVALHVPVFDQGVFDGSLALVISFDVLSETYLKNINLSKNENVLLISEKGKELYCPFSEHVGQSLFDKRNNQSGLIDLGYVMINQEAGISHYSITQKINNETELVKYHAAFCSIPLGDTHWIIAISTPEPNVLDSMKGYRNQWFLLLSLLLAGIGLYSILANRALNAVQRANQQKTREEIHRENERNMRTFVTNSPVPTAFNDPNTGFLMLNHAFTNATGYTQEDIPNLQDWFVQYLDNPIMIDQVLENLEHSTLGLQEWTTPQQVKITCKNGLEKTFEFRYSRMASRHILNLIDITGKLEAENQKRKLEDQLARAKKMEALGLLAGGVAHDLNNILSGVVTYPELILMKLPEDSPLRKPLNAIMTAGKRAATVVQDLLTLARGAAYSGCLFQLQDLINGMKDETVKLVSNSDTRATITLTWQCNSDTPALFGPEYHMRKAITNLVLNAAEAMIEDGTIHISCNPVELNTQLDGFERIPPGQYCLLCVEDNGPGIEPADVERIFEPFFTRKRMGKSGSGLGLMIVWNTIKEFKGFIDLKTDSSGTSFRIYLPPDERAEGAVPKESEISAELIRGNQRKILLVDDDSGQRDLGRQLLQMLDFDAEVVGTSQVAIQLARQNEYDLILLDMIMEGDINGDEIFHQIQTFKPDQKAVIVSGYSETESISKALERGAHSLLKKPYSIQQLSATLKSVLDVSPDQRN